MRPRDAEWSSIKRGADAASFRFLTDAEVRHLLAQAPDLDQVGAHGDAKAKRTTRDTA